jgi:hypothetical protein
MPRLCYVPVEIPKAGKLVDLDGVPEPGEVNGVQLFLDEREVVPDQAGLDDLLLICCPHRALGRREGALTADTRRTLLTPKATASCFYIITSNNFRLMYFRKKLAAKTRSQI